MERFFNYRTSEFLPLTIKDQKEYCWPNRKSADMKNSYFLTEIVYLDINNYTHWCNIVINKIVKDKHILLNSKKNPHLFYIVSQEIISQSLKK